jgi:hypothetical protein
VPLRAAAPLFPTALHIVRRVDDPLIHRSVTVNEYCHGDRIVSVNGPLTMIVDYQRQEITEIDHRVPATYSITRFEDVAKARAPRAASAGAGEARPTKVTPLGIRASAAGRSLEAFEIVTARHGWTEKIEAGVDRQIGLSRAAAEALIGAAYPGNQTDEHDALLNLAAPRPGGRATTNAVATDQYGLISEQTITYESEGSVVVVKSSVLAVDSKTVPPDALLIDPGARRVESRLTRVQQELHDIDQLPSRPDKP